MKVWITLRQDTYHRQEGYDHPIDDMKVVAGNVFDCLEKAKTYVEQMIVQDKQKYFNQDEKPIEYCYESPADIGINYELFADNCDPEYSEYSYHEIVWKIREREVQ